MMKKENPIVLTYGDATLRKSDQENFKDGNWLTDNCISFYYEYLNNKFANDEILFVDPSSVAFMFFESELEDILDTFAPLKFGSRKYIFIPLNDKEDKFQAVGGSHWALLVYIVEEEYFIYFDSSSGVISSVYDIAMKVYAVAHETTEPVDEKTLKMIHYKNSPKQVNSYDCGMYTILLTERVAKWLAVDGKPLEDKPEEFEDLKPSFVTKKRKELYELVNDLAVKKGKDKGF